MEVKYRKMAEELASTRSQLPDSDDTERVQFFELMLDIDLICGQLTDELELLQQHLRDAQVRVERAERELENERLSSNATRTQLLAELKVTTENGELLQAQLQTFQEVSAEKIRELKRQVCSLCALFTSLFVLAARWQRGGTAWRHRVLSARDDGVAVVGSERATRRPRGRGSATSDAHTALERRGGPPASDAQATCRREVGRVQCSVVGIYA